MLDVRRIRSSNEAFYKDTGSVCDCVKCVLGTELLNDTAGMCVRSSTVCTDESFELCSRAFEGE